MGQNNWYNDSIGWHMKLITHSLSANASGLVYSLMYT